MDLRHVTDKQLLKDTLDLVQNERENTSMLLHHLREIDRRKLFSDLRCSSLFDYCTRILGYAEASAHRRIQAARLINDIPEIELKLEYGTLTMSNISQAVSFFTQEDIREPEEKKKILIQLEGMSKKECEKKLFEISGNEVPAKEEKKRISKDKNKISMIISDQTLEKLDHVKALIGKNLSNEKLIEKMADIAIERISKKKFGVAIISSSTDTSAAT